MMSVVQNHSANFLSYVVNSLDQLDDNSKREPVFAKKAEVKQETSEATQPQSIKDLSLDLLDIGIHQSNKNFQRFKESQAYSITDPYVHYDQRLESLKSESVNVAQYLNDRVYFPLRENLICFVDQGRKMYSFLIQIINEHQEKIVNYVNTHYENVLVTLKDNWMRLDFNDDGKVSLEDLKAGMIELYDFLRSYEYIQKAQEVKSQLYDQAINYMKKEVKEPKAPVEDEDEEVEIDLEPVEQKPADQDSKLDSLLAPKKEHIE